MKVSTLANLKKNMGSFVSNVSPKTAETSIIWGTPLMIPPLRYFQDEEKPQKLRKELLYRDFSTYSVGTGVYFAIKFLVSKLLESKQFNKVSNSSKNLVGVMIGMTAYVMYNAIGAIKTSKMLTNILHKYPPEKCKCNKNDTMKK